LTPRRYQFRAKLGRDTEGCDIILNIQDVYELPRRASSWQPRISMARSYHVDIARFAADADQKWVDNLLSHFVIPGVEAARQGVARRIAPHGVYSIALIRRLTRDLGVSTERALALADRLLSSHPGEVRVSADLELRIDREAFERAIDERIAEAVESIVPAPRGRPRLRAANVANSE
jgi:hypothetical protein